MRKPGHTTIPYPRIRKATVDLLTAARRKGGGYYSFTGYIIRCVAEAVERNRIVHACRDMRGRLVLFDDDGMYIHTICVESGSRGKGIGTAVLNEPAEENPKMYLYVNDKNDAAIRFYEKNGFRKKNHRKMKYKGNELGEYLMERK